MTFALHVALLPRHSPIVASPFAGCCVAASPLIAGLEASSYYKVKINIPATMTTDTILQDQKKLTLDALERRFALAEDEFRLHQRKNKQRPYDENKKQLLMCFLLPQM
ncbi:hypothetical protein U1Q18_043276 [Sarracenia purpurea var. burkii]